MNHLPDDLCRVIGFLRWLHDDREGWFFINAGIADDTTPTGILMLLPCKDRPEIVSTRRWFYYDPKHSKHAEVLEKAARYVLELEAEHGNVYTGRTLFRSKSAKIEYAYASPILFLDDAPRETPLPYSVYVDTGTGNGQAYYKLTTAVVKRDALRVKRGLGADPTGSADNKLLRIPGTRNTKTKHGGNYPVQVDVRTPGRYTADQLRAAFPGEVDEPTKERAAKPWDADKEQRLAAVFRNVRRMLTPDGLPRVLQGAPQDNQGRRIFADPAYIATWKHPSGTWDASTVRHIRARALAGRGLTRIQVAALLYACEDKETIRIKGSTAVWNDIKGRADYWCDWFEGRGVKPSEYSVRLEDAMCGNCDNTAPTPETLRARRGRPRTTLTPDAMLATYREHAEGAILALSRKERAALLGISTATLDRLEQVLRDRGDIIVHTSADRKSSHVEICDNTAPEDRGVIKIQEPEVIVITPEAIPVERIRTPETVSPRARTRRVTHPSVGHPPATKPGCVPPPPRSGATSPLNEAVYAELRACEADERVNTQTGEIRPGRVSFKRIAAKIRETRQVQDAVLRYAYDKQMARRKAERQVEKLPYILPKRFKALIGVIDRILQTGKSDPRYWWAWYLYDAVSAEQERRASLRRGLSADHRKRQIAKADQDELWDAVELAGVRPITRPILRTATQAPPITMAAAV